MQIGRDPAEEKLVNSGSPTAGSQKLDDPANLSPTTEIDEIPEITAAIGARRRLVGGISPEARDQVGSVGDGRSIGKMNVGLQRFSIVFMVRTPRFTDPALPYCAGRC
jgi:hypothetical protein